MPRELCTAAAPLVGCYRLLHVTVMTLTCTQSRYLTEHHVTCVPLLPLQAVSYPAVEPCFSDVLPRV
jgi:hypothetical protein